MAGFLHGQTRLDPAQVQNWHQVSPPGGTGLSGTKIQIAQLSIDPAVAAIWAEIIRAWTYDHFRMAVVPDQPNPILIVCLRPETDPLGPGCVGGQFWFSPQRQ